MKIDSIPTQHNNRLRVKAHLHHRKHSKMKILVIYIFYIQFIEIYQPSADEYGSKMDNLYLKGILTEKMLLFDDSNVRIGCIRTISTEWRQATLKLYIGNKSKTDEISDVVFTKEL